MTLQERIEALFAARGSEAYFGERVSMTEHGLQAAYFAADDGAPPALVVAALLHDIGHLIEEVPADIADWKTDAHHEEKGSLWLSRHFGPEVSEPVRLHVPAKRYLCAVDTRYFDQLSEASIVTLRLQGGPMSPAEIARFEAEPFHRDAVRVRRCDDLGKIVNLKTPTLRDYAALIDAFAS